MPNALPGRVAKWLPHARAAELVYGIDPLLILAIVDRESWGGDALQPRGPGGKGDNGHGHGLGQLDIRYHATFLAAMGPDGKLLWQDPGFNILYLALHLYTDLHRFEGRGVNPLLPAIASYNASHKRVANKLRELTLPTTDEQVISALDPLTTASKKNQPGDYLSDILAKRKSYVLTP